MVCSGSVHASVSLFDKSPSPRQDHLKSSPVSRRHQNTGVPCCGGFIIMLRVHALNCNMCMYVCARPTFFPHRELGSLVCRFLWVYSVGLHSACVTSPAWLRLPPSRESLSIHLEPLDYSGLALRSL